MPISWLIGGALPLVWIPVLSPVISALIEMFVTVLLLGTGLRFTMPRPQAGLPLGLQLKAVVLGLWTTVFQRKSNGEVGTVNQFQKEAEVVECPKCGRKNRINDPSRGTYRCAACKAPLAAERTDEEEVIECITGEEFRCGSCKKPLTFSRDGKTDPLLIVECPNCNAKNRIGKTRDLERTAKLLSPPLFLLSEDTAENVSAEVTDWTVPNDITMDFWLLAFHVLDRAIFVVYGAKGRRLFTDALLRELFTSLSSAGKPDSETNLGQVLIQGLNSFQAEFAKFRKLFPEKEGDDYTSPVVRSLYGAESTDYVLVEFVRRRIYGNDIARFTFLRPASVLSVWPLTMAFYIETMKLLRASLLKASSVPLSSTDK